MKTLILTILAAVVTSTLAACSPNHPVTNTNTNTNTSATKAFVPVKVAVAAAPSANREDWPSVAKLKDRLDLFNNVHIGEPIQLPISDVAFDRCWNDFYHVVCTTTYRYGNRIVSVNLAFEDGELNSLKTFPIPVLRDLSIQECAAVKQAIKCQIGWMFYDTDESYVLINPINGQLDKIADGEVQIRDEIILKSRDLKSGTVQGFFPGNFKSFSVGIEAVRKASPTLIDTLPISTR